MTKKIFVLGIDGGTFDLVNKWIDQLPTFRKLLTGGAYAVLESTIPNSSTPAWHSFYNSMGLGSLGMYYHMGSQAGEYSPKLFETVTGKEVWHVVSKNNKTAGVFSGVGVYPPQKLNGFMVCGTFYPQGSTFTYPPELMDELGKNYPTGTLDLDSESLDEQVKVVCEQIDVLSKFILSFYKKYKSDFYLGIYDYFDVPCHFFWKYSDPTHPLYEPGHEDLILNCYKKVDETLRQILEEIKDTDTTLIVMSDHGFKATYKNFNINSWLIKNGFLKLKKGKSNASINKIRDSLVRFAIKTGVRKFIPQKVKENVKISFKDIDWEQTKAYASYSGSIFINLKGRESQGIVTNDDYDKIKDEIVEKLTSLQDDGVKVINKVYKREELYHGDKVDKMPDLMVFTDSQYTALTPAIKSEMFELSELSGNHAQEGMFIAYGKDIKPSKVSLELVDIAPTILHIMDIPIPIYMEGRVVKDLFTDSLKNKEVEYELEKDKTAIEKERVSQILGRI